MEKKALFLLIIIFLIAVFFRLWKLNEIPPGLYPDSAIYGNDALASLKNRDFKVFYPENNGREGLYMWLLALSFSIFGVSIWSLRIVGALIGVLTVFGLYCLTKELVEIGNWKLEIGNLKNEAVPLLASFLLATSFWHTNFSRFGFRAILQPFILVFFLYFLLKGFRTLRLYNFIISGIFFGLGFYTYISYRFVVLILPAIFIPYWFFYKKEGSQKKFLLFTFYFLLFTFFVALPIGIYFLQNPQDFVGRATPISIFATGNPIKEFLKSLILHLGMFNIYGDPNWRHNFSGSPMLPWPLGILFLIGLFFSIKELISWIRNKNLLLVTSHWLLITSFFTMLLPGILTYEGIPHSLRVIGVIPVVYIFVALGGFKIYKFFEKNTERKTLLILASIFFLIAISFSEFDKYFLDWGRNKEVEGAFTKRFVLMGDFLNSLPENIQKYVIVNESGVPVPWSDGIPMPAQTIMFIEATRENKEKITYLLPEDLNRVKIDNKKTVILPIKSDQSLFEELCQRFPRGEKEEKTEFSIYKINF